MLICRGIFALINLIKQKGKSGDVKCAECGKCGGKTQSGGIVCRRNGKLKQNERNAGYGLLEHIVYRRNRCAGFFNGEGVDMVDVGNRKCKLEADADADEHQTHNGKVRHFEIKAQNHTRERI